MHTGHCFHRRLHPNTAWTTVSAIVALAAFFALATVAGAQQAQKEKTGQQPKSATQSPPKQAQPPAKPAQPPGQGTAQSGSQAGQGAAASGDKGGDQSGQQPSVMPNQPMCPCPLITKDSVEPHFQEVCGRCHTPDRITGTKKSGLEWKETIDKMILKGAQVSDDDYDVILAFLVRNFDRVDINWVESGELVVALGLTNDEAEKIVAYRKEHGDFKDFDALAKVPGVDVKKLEAKKKSIAFQ